MKQKDKDKIIDRYTTRLEQHGPVPQALGWLKGRQAFRFHFLAEAQGFENSDSVLDVGCAFGDLEPFLKQRGWNGRYTGVDIVPGLIEEGLKKYPHLDLRVADIQEDKLDGPYDWVLSSGALTSETEEVDSYNHLQHMLEVMFDNCRKGVSANFVSPYVEFQSDVNFHPSMDRFMSIVQGISKRFSMRFDYMPYEFTVYLYKDDDIVSDYSIFAHYEELYRKLKTK